MRKPFFCRSRLEFDGRKAFLSYFYMEVFCGIEKVLNKQYITVDNSIILLYTVCRRRDEVESNYKSYFHGTNL